MNRSVAGFLRLYCFVCLLSLASGSTYGEKPARGARDVSISMGRRGTIVSITPGRSRTSNVAGVSKPSYPFPRPRLAGFSPWIAITTSDKRRSVNDDDFEHDLHASYIGNSLTGSASTDFVLGILDSGAAVDLVAGSFAEVLGITGPLLTDNIIQIGGVGDPVDAYVTQTLAFFAAGLSSINEEGVLDLSAVRGHSNVSAIASPPIDCGSGEVVSAVLGTPFIAFHNFHIRVDNPRKITKDGVTVQGPDVTIHDKFDELPFYQHAIALEFGGELPGVTTASYWPNYFEFEDLVTPWIPTLLSVFPGARPSGGAFFTTIFVLHGEPSPTNIVQPMRVLVDTGAQTSIMSEAMVAALSLPNEPDFTIDACGVGGLVPGLAGYYVDYVKINARGGALEFSRAPFIVLDLPSIEGNTVILDGILGMNFFWNRNITFEPSITATGFLTVSEPIPFAAGDFDLNLSVDPNDVAALVSCLTGPDGGQLSPDCEHIDVDQDGQIGLYDFSLLQNCYSGQEVAADPSCGG